MFPVVARRIAAPPFLFRPLPVLGADGLSPSALPGATPSTVPATLAGRHNE
jgi:hypothetical protein